MTAIDDWITELLSNRGSGNVEPLRSDIDTVVAALGLLNAGQLQAGLYTPTLTLGANVAAATANPTPFLRVGNMVVVAGQIEIDPTAATLQTSCDISLPVASDIQIAADLGGVGTRVASGVVTVCATITGNTVNNRATLSFFNDADLNNRAWKMIFGYQII